jgi:hypothetical protein
MQFETRVEAIVSMTPKTREQEFVELSGRVAKSNTVVTRK